MITMTVPVTSYKYVYVANDGMEFSTREDCEEYERKLCNVDKYESLVVESVFASDFFNSAGLLPSYDSNDGFDVVRIKDRSDVEIINKLAGDEIIDDTMIGKKLISQYNEMDHEIYACYTRDDMVAAFVNTIDNLIGKDD